MSGKSFYSRKQLEQHAQDPHSTVNRNEMIKAVKKPFKISNKLLAVTGILYWSIIL